eukprot:XP_027299148.1 uncharacterized protein LOC113839716 [Anas platyrhynchos]
MQLPAVCCRAWLLLLVLRWAGAQAAGGEHGAELRSLQVPGPGPGPGRAGDQGAGAGLPVPLPRLLPSLSFLPQDLLEALGQLRDEEGELALDEEPEAGAEDGGPEWDLPGTPLPAPSPTEPAEGQSRWRSLLSSSRRRHFSGCFGTRMERIGAQTGLGCNHYRARRSRLGPGAAPRLVPACHSPGERGRRWGTPAALRPFSSRFLEEKEKLKPGPASSSLRAGIQPPGSHAPPTPSEPPRGWVLSNKPFVQSVAV